MANKWVYTFKEGNMTMRNLLGGKGANLAEMTEIGLPVPQGFTISQISDSSTSCSRPSRVLQRMLRIQYIFVLRQHRVSL